MPNIRSVAPPSAAGGSDCANSPTPGSTPSTTRIAPANVPTWRLPTPVSWMTPLFCANVVLGNAFDVPGITVDTHFGRLVRRFGWTAEEDPVKVEHIVGDLFPRKDWTMLSHRLIFHGRRVCHARKPACGACTLSALCPSYGTGPTDLPTAVKLLKGPRVDELAAMVGA